MCWGMDLEGTGPLETEQQAKQGMFIDIKSLPHDLGINDLSRTLWSQSNMQVGQFLKLEGKNGQ